MNDMTIKVLAIPGSLRAGSNNRRLVRSAAELAPAGVGLELYDGYSGIPIFDETLEAGEVAGAVVALRKAVREADALLFATPEYNGSVPGGLKNAIDWASRPYGQSSFAGKPALVIGASVSPNGARWAQADLRKILGVAGAEVIDSELPVGPASAAFDEDGELVDRGVRDALAERVQSLVGAVLRKRAEQSAA